MPRSKSPRGRGSRSRSRSRTRSRSRGRKRSRSVSSYSSSSRSPSSSYSRSASSYSRSSYSRSRSRSYRRRRSPPRRSRSYDRRRISPRPRRRSRTPSPKRVLIRNITRNVNEEHLKEIFGTFGDVAQVVIPMHPKIKGTNTGKAEVFFKASSGAEKARRHMDGAQIDGNVVEVIMMVQDRGGRRPPPPYSQGRFGAQGRPRSRSPRRSDIRGRNGPRRSPFRRRSRSPIRR